MEVADLAYLKEKISALEAKFGKTGLANVIIKTAEAIKRKKPSTQKEVAIERAYSLVSAQLDTSKGFKHYKVFVPISVKIGDWNRYKISDIVEAWQGGEILVRDKLIKEGKIFSQDGKPVAKIVKSHKDEDGGFVVDECVVIDDNNKTAIPVLRDYEAKVGKPPEAGKEDKRKDNPHFGFPLDSRMHMEAIGVAFEETKTKTVPVLIQLRYNGETASDGSPDFMGPTLWGRMMKPYELRAKMIKEDDAIPIHDGDSAIWGDEIDDPEIDVKLFEAATSLENLKPIMLNEMEGVYSKFFKGKEGKNLYDRYAISEVTIKKIEEPNPTFEWAGQTLYVRDSSLSEDDQDARASVPKWINITPPAMPCQAIMVYYLKESDGKWDKKLRKKIDGKSYQPQVVGMGFVSGAELDDETKEALNEAMGDL